LPICYSIHNIYCVTFIAGIRHGDVFLVKCFTISSCNHFNLSIVYGIYWNN